jgi:hypothetical protein|tara:strand:- start:11506 stop:11619 length:114 start_codon:yes stop_codon:yes gene_type:complete
MTSLEVIKNNIYRRENITSFLNDVTLKDKEVSNEYRN